MPCKNYKNLVAALTEDVEQAVPADWQNHASGCKPCGRDLEELRSARALDAHLKEQFRGLKQELSGSKSGLTPEILMQRMQGGAERPVELSVMRGQKKASQRPATTKRSEGFWRYGVAAAAMVVIIVSFGIFKYGEQGSSELAQADHRQPDEFIADANTKSKQPEEAEAVTAEEKNQAAAPATGRSQPIITARSTPKRALRTAPGAGEKDLILERSKSPATEIDVRDEKGAMVAMSDDEGDALTAVSSPLETADKTAEKKVALAKEDAFRGKREARKTEATGGAMSKTKATSLGPARRKQLREEADKLWKKVNAGTATDANLNRLDTILAQLNDQPGIKKLRRTRASMAARKARKLREAAAEKAVKFTISF